MTDVVYLVEYTQDAGRRMHEVYDVCGNLPRAKEAVREAIGEFDDDAVVETTRYDPTSLLRWVCSNPVDDVWRLSSDGTYAAKNAWTYVKIEERMVSVGADDASASSTIAQGADGPGEGFWPELWEMESHKDNMAFSEALSRALDCGERLRVTFKDRRPLQQPVIDMTYFVAKLVYLAGRQDADRGYSLQ